MKCSKFKRRSKNKLNISQRYKGYTSSPMMPHWWLLIVEDLAHAHGEKWGTEKKSGRRRQPAHFIVVRGEEVRRGLGGTRRGKGSKRVIFGWHTRAGPGGDVGAAVAGWQVGSCGTEQGQKAPNGRPQASAEGRESERCGLVGGAWMAAAQKRQWPADEWVPWSFI
jgi:hypothetical protein